MSGTLAPADGSALPFPPTPSDSVAGPTLQESKMQCRVEPRRLPKDAPNILIVLLDDVGFGLPDTYGGPIHTSTQSKLADEGISYNAFHATGICLREIASGLARSIRSDDLRSPVWVVLQLSFALLTQLKTFRYAIS